MDKTAVVEIIDRLRNEVEERGIKLQSVILYGSEATGFSREDSDIDVVIVSDDFANKSYWERIDILTEAIFSVSAPIEAVAMTTDEWEHSGSLIAEFARNGDVLYAS